MVACLVNLETLCLLVQVFKFDHNLPDVRFLRYLELADSLVQKFRVYLEETDDNSAAAILDHYFILGKGHRLSDKV